MTVAWWKAGSEFKEKTDPGALEFSLMGKQRGRFCDRNIKSNTRGCQDCTADSDKRERKERKKVKNSNEGKGEVTQGLESEAKLNPL